MSDIKVPVLPESVQDATVATWHKKPGEWVDQDENLVDIETDKVVLEVVAPTAGVLEKIIKNTGDTVDGYFKGRHLQKVNAFNLTGGKHSIEIYSLHASLLELMWNKKGAANSQPVPVDALEPDYQITTK